MELAFSWNDGISKDFPLNVNPFLVGTCFKDRFISLRSEFALPSGNVLVPYDSSLTEQDASNSGRVKSKSKNAVLSSKRVYNRENCSSGKRLRETYKIGKQVEGFWTYWETKGMRWCQSELIHKLNFLNRCIHFIIWIRLFFFCWG